MNLESPALFWMPEHLLLVLCNNTPSGGLLALHPDSGSMNGMSLAAPLAYGNFEI